MGKEKKRRNYVATVQLHYSKYSQIAFVQIVSKVSPKLFWINENAWMQLFTL